MMIDIDYLDTIGFVLDERLRSVFDGRVFCRKQRLLGSGRVDCLNLCMVKCVGAEITVAGDIIIDGGSLLVLNTTCFYKYDLCDPDVIDKVVFAVGVIYSRVFGDL